MTIVFTNLGATANPDINDSSNATSYANSSWTPPTSGLIIVCTHSRDPLTGPSSPTVSGNNLTWTNIIGPIAGSDNDAGLTLFAANASGSTAGVTTFDYSGVEQTHLTALFCHVTGVDLSSGVAAAFVQTPTLANQAAATSGSITLSAPADSNNRPFVFFEHGANEATTPRANWTELDDADGSGRNRGLETQYRDDAFETTASASWTTSVKWAAIAAELKIESAGATLTAAQGSYTLTGQTTNLLATRLLTAVQGSYTLTGQTAALLRQYTLTAVQGTYTLTGQTASLLAARQLAAVQGTYTQTGQDADLIYSSLGAYTLIADQGSYTLTGQTASLLAARLLAADQGSYTLTGQIANLLATRLLTAVQGSYTLTGQTAALLRQYTLTAVQGSYTLTGQDLDFIRLYMLTAVHGSYTLTGYETQLDYSGYIPYDITADVNMRLTATADVAVRITAAANAAMRLTATADVEL